MAQSPWDQPYNIILAGSFGVGKSTIFNKLSTEVHCDFQYASIQNTPVTSQNFGKWTHSTSLDRISSVPQEVKVTLWDTGNMELKGIRNVTRSYFRQAVGVILVYDIGNCETLDSLQDWMMLVKDSFSWEWQDNVSFVVWGNDRDQYLNSVSPEILSNFIIRNGLLEELCYHVNGYHGTNLFESYHSLIEKVHTQLTKIKQQTLSAESTTVDLHDSQQSESSCWCS